MESVSACFFLAALLRVIVPRANENLYVGRLFRRGENEGSSTDVKATHEFVIFRVRYSVIRSRVILVEKLCSC
jgi:hypothetical protein